MANEQGTRDTTGVTGNPGAIPIGTQQRANVKDTSVDGDAARFGGGPFADPAPAEDFDTSAGSGYGMEHLADYSQVDVNFGPVDTSITATTETVYPGAHHINRTYQAPAPYFPASNIDTSWTDVTGVGYNINREVPLQYYYYTLDTYTVGAGAPGLLGSEDITLATAGTTLAQTGIFMGSLVVKTNGGKTESKSQTFDISETPTELVGSGILDATVVVSAVVDGDEDVALTDDEQPVNLAQTGIVSALSDIVVTHEGSTLTSGTDYTLTDNGETGDARVVSIAWVSGGSLPLGTETVNVAYQHTQNLTEDTDYTVTAEGADAHKVVSVALDTGSAIVSEGDEVHASYDVGGYGYFFSRRLVEGIDYTSERNIVNGEVETTVYPTETSENASDGDDVTVTFLYGTFGEFGARFPDDVPNAPGSVFAFARDRGVEVQWNHPAGGESYDGFLIEVSNEHSFEVSANEGVEGAGVEEKTVTASGMVYVSAHESSALLGELEPDRQFNEHDPGNESVFGTREDYVFRVAAVNRHGVGPYTDWTTVATAPMNFDLNRPTSIPPKNRVNPIYRADGTVVPGTGIGA